MTEIDVKKVRLSGGIASDAALPTGAVGKREPRPWAVETPNHTCTLILILLGSAVVGSFLSVVMIRSNRKKAAKAKAAGKKKA